MQSVSVVGYPRIGPKRELKKWVEDYFKGKIGKDDLLYNATRLRKEHWTVQFEKGIDYIPANDFSFYDTFLDTAWLLNVIPAHYRELGLDDLDTYFAMAKGYQDETGDVKALPMKKWFNTNYHFLVPTIDSQTQFKLNGGKPFTEYTEALDYGIKTKPVLIGPFTFLKLSKTNGNRRKFDYLEEISVVYRQILKEFNGLGATLIQIDEPALVTDLGLEEKEAFTSIYQKILRDKGSLKIILQTYFGDVRDIYSRLVSLDFDGIGLDFIEGFKNLKLIEENGYPQDKLLFAGLVNGKNIWKNNYSASLDVLDKLRTQIDKDNIVLNTSCSLLHLPYTVNSEMKLDERFKKHLAFAEEKLDELIDLAVLSDDPEYKANDKWIKNSAVILEKQAGDVSIDHKIRERVAGLTTKDFIRTPCLKERNIRQKKELNLPCLPTTTIGSFPQTSEVRRLRRRFRDGDLSSNEYDNWIKGKIKDLIRLQEEIGLDVLVHGEFERADMVEYFGEKLDGFLLTENGWVQSYGTRCVKPPIIFGDIHRRRPITVEYIKYAQQLTDKPVKGMLTGPITILNWSFPREDISLAEIAYQIALAIQAEVLDLEANGIRIIQIDEAALREKLPLRKEEWHHNYLDWAIRAFRLVHANIKTETQIHTHMCYSEFEDIIHEIAEMDADVISFEAARSDLSIIDAFKDDNLQAQVGPGVYDIHSPRVPGENELVDTLEKILNKVDVDKLWVNPDCGLKTRGMEETVPSLRNMVAAADRLRVNYGVKLRRKLGAFRSDDLQT